MPNSVARRAARREFRPTLWPTLAAGALIIATVTLGNWQRHRASEKRALSGEYAIAVSAPALPFDGTLPDLAALRYRRVQISGTYLTDKQVLIDNKLHAGKAGYDVVTPLRMARSGRTILIDRGWIPVGTSRAVLPVVPAPANRVTIEGRVALPPRYFELQANAHPGTLWQNLDIGRMSTTMGLDLLPVFIEQLSTENGGDGLLRDWPAPDFGVGQHLSYMVQWYSLAGLAIVLWLSLNWRERRKSLP